MKNTHIIAHRGLSSTYPENTMLAFKEAWQQGCDGIELDIQVTKDAQVVVIHDPCTKRTGVEKLVVNENIYADLQHINVGQFVKGTPANFNQTIPLLTDVIKAMPTGKLIQIEIKHHITNIQAVINCLQHIRSDIVVQIISFSAERLLAVKKALPHFQYFLVIDDQYPKITDRVAFAVEHGLTGLDMDYRMATPTFVQQVLDADLVVAHWTVNNSDDAQRLIAQGATYIASDFADALL